MNQLLHLRKHLVEVFPITVGEARSAWRILHGNQQERPQHVAEVAICNLARSPSCQREIRFRQHTRHERGQYLFRIRRDGLCVVDKPAGDRVRQIVDVLQDIAMLVLRDRFDEVTHGLFKRHQNDHPRHEPSKVVEWRSWADRQSMVDEFMSDGHHPFDSLAHRPPDAIVVDHGRKAALR